MTGRRPIFLEVLHRKRSILGRMRQNIQARGNSIDKIELIETIAIELRKSNGTQCFLLHPPHPPLSPILGERIKVRGHALSIRHSIIYTNINN